MGDMQFNGTPEEWDALVKKNRERNQTAVEWLALRYHHRQGYLSQEDIEQAKNMEKEQMKGMYVEGGFAQMRYFDGKEFITGEQYYNEIFNK